MVKIFWVQGFKRLIYTVQGLDGSRVLEPQCCRTGVQQSEMGVPWSLFISVCGFASMCRASLMRRTCLLLS